MMTGFLIPWFIEIVSVYALAQLDPTVSTYGWWNNMVPRNPGLKYYNFLRRIVYWRHPLDFRQYFSSACILENGVVLISKMGTFARLVVFFNLKEKTYEHFVEFAGDTGFETVSYRETLVSPDALMYKTNNVSLFLYFLSIMIRMLVVWLPCVSCRYYLVSYIWQSLLLGLLFHIFLQLS